jgi:anti-sigma factor RsiW
MSKGIDLARFEALVAAYGATPARWPEEERAAAEAFARSDPRAADLLAQADAIDTLLFAHRVAEPSRTLRTMVIESAPRRKRVARRVRLWWSSIGFAIAAAAGALAGSAATAALAPAALNVQLYQHDEVLNYDDTAEEVVK